MKLSTKTRYGVRALFDIAFHNQGRATQARDIARRQDVPLRYLEQIFQELRRAHLVEAKRGPRGGYSLARAAEAITLGDVVRAVQGPIDLIDLAPASRAKKPALWPNIWGEVAQKVSAAFDEVSIEDLCRRGEALGIHRGDSQPHMYFI
ncbi:MAG: RrF2 family transcriptional regulator [Polyangia bacterium]|jgi:Rrf2 family protein